MHKVGDLLFRSGVGFGFIHHIYDYPRIYDIKWMMEYGTVIRGGFQEYEIEDMKRELQREANRSP